MRRIVFSKWKNTVVYIELLLKSCIVAFLQAAYSDSFLNYGVVRI
jgi:hypothetical protein